MREGVGGLFGQRIAARRVAQQEMNGQLRR
jgi:hypothetical protein